MLQGSVIDLSATISIMAAKISLGEKMPMADSIILATARLYQATVWTEDADFFGTGIAVWTTNRIEIFLEAQIKPTESE